jgi:hypothetical protein
MNSQTRSTPRKSRKSEGKISKLSNELQEFVASQIEAKTPYDDIIQALAEAGHPGIHPWNITNWKKWGDQHLLLRRQRQLDRDAERKEAVALAEKENGGPPAALFYMAISRLMRHLQVCDSQLFEEKAEKDPAVYLSLFRNVAWTTKAGCAWLRLIAAKNKRSADCTSPNPPTDEVIEFIDRKYNILDPQVSAEFKYARQNPPPTP